MNIRHQQGQDAILIIFVLGMIATLIGFSQVKLGTLESFRGRSSANSLQAYYSANSGIEDAIKRLEDGDVNDATLSVGGETNNVTVTIDDIDDNTKIIRSVAKNGKFVRRIQAKVLNSTIIPGFFDAIFAGAGGLYLDNNVVVKNIETAEDANVYSRTFIKGRKNSHNASGCKNDSSAVYGSATAVDQISKWSNSDSGICVTKDAFATNLNQCYVFGDTVSVNSPSGQCQVGGSITSGSAAPELFDIPELGINSIKDYLSGQEEFSGDCLVDGVDPADCTKGTGVLGNIVIDGDLTVASNEDLVISGPIWIKGNLIINSQDDISMLDETTSRIVIVDGKINISSNVDFASYDSVFLIMASTYDEGEPLTCNDGNDAITISSNVPSVLFYADKGCVAVAGPTAGSEITGAIYGNAVYLKNNSVLIYDPDLATAEFNLSEDGGFIITEFNEY